MTLNLDVDMYYRPYNILKIIKEICINNKILFLTSYISNISNNQKGLCLLGKREEKI